MAGEEVVTWTDLIQRLRSGDAAAEEELCAFFFPRVVTMATGRLRDPEQAREIAQETMLAILPALRNGHLRDPEKLPGYVCGTSRNLINNHRRRLSRDSQTLPLPANAVMPGAPGEAQHEARDERRRLVRLVLQVLKPIDRKILLLTLVEGMNPREIAPILKMDAELVRTRKARALRKVLDRVKGMTRNCAGSHK